MTLAGIGLAPILRARMRRIIKFDGGEDARVGIEDQAMTLNTAATKTRTMRRANIGVCMRPITVLIKYIIKIVRREALGGPVSIGLTTTQVGLSQ
jgi:hypothetical protein